jgi:IS605 OrfB family transposase
VNRQRGRERRFVTAQNPAIAKAIVVHAFQTFRAPVIAMEDLTGIREQAYVGKAQRTRLATWSFGQLQQFIEHKAMERGIPVVYVDPRHTSQRCPWCGHVGRANRNRRLHVFTCQACGYTSNDDRVASMNVRDRGVVL